jgi:hypothetical protein
LFESFFSSLFSRAAKLLNFVIPRGFSPEESAVLFSATNFSAARLAVAQRHLEELDFRSV